jgi:hypothetical protein
MRPGLYMKKYPVPSFAGLNTGQLILLYLTAASRNNSYQHEQNDALLHREADCNDKRAIGIDSSNFLTEVQHVSERP